MSFILEALKKSESERQRQSGPALFEVKVAPPRPRIPLWVSIVGALLLVNLVGVAWLLMRNSSPAPSRQEAASPARETAASPPAAPSSGAVSPAPTAATQAPPAGQPPVWYPQPQAAGQPMGASAYGQMAGSFPMTPGTPPAYPGWNPTAVPPGAYPTAPNVQYPYPGPAGAQYPATPGMAAPAGTVGYGYEGASQAANDVSSEFGINPDDFEPARPAPAAQASSSQTTRSRRDGLPTYEDVADRPGANLPELRLDLHVYSPNANDRFVYINGRKLREGESLPQGVRVESITQEGVTLSHRGTRFVLMRN